MDQVGTFDGRNRIDRSLDSSGTRGSGLEVVDAVYQIEVLMWICHPYYYLYLVAALHSDFFFLNYHTELFSW